MKEKLEYEVRRYLLCTKVGGPGLYRTVRNKNINTCLSDCQTSLCLIALGTEYVYDVATNLPAKQ